MGETYCIIKISFIQLYHFNELYYLLFGRVIEFPSI